MLKRPLVFAALLFVLGIFLAAYSVNLIITEILCIAICSFTYRRTGNKVISLIAAALILAGVFRMGLAENYRKDIIGKFSGKKETMKLTVTEFSSDNRTTAYFKDGNRKYKVLLTVEETINLYPGDVVEGEFSLHPPLRSKTGLVGSRESYAGNNVFLVAEAEKVRITEEKEKGFSGKIHSFRVYMDGLGEGAFFGDDRALFNAMIFGDKRLISDELYSALQASGLNHIAVVSGMHLSVAIAFITVFARKIFGKKRMSYVFILAGAFLMTLVTGAGASVIRAFIMCILFLMAQIFRRDPDSPSSLAFAVLVMTAVNPFIIFNLGFVLSVLSITGIFLFNTKLSDFFVKFMPYKLAGILSVSISAQLMVLPVSVYCFGTLAPYSLLSNMLLVPIAGIYVILGMVYVLFPHLPFILWCMKLLSGITASTCYAVEEFDSSLISFTGTLTVFFVVWFFLLALLYARPSNRKQRRIFAAMFTLISVLIYTAPEKPEVTVCTVPYYNGKMSAFINSGGDSFLIDCPSIYDVRQIEEAGNPFTTAILTSGRTGQIFTKENDIERVFVSAEIFKEKKKERLFEKVGDSNIQVVFVKDSEKFQVGSAIAEYIAVEGVKNFRAVKIECDGKTFITLQSFEGKSLLEAEKSGIKFVSDYIILPITSVEFNEACFTGKILK